MARGIERRKIFFDDKDRESFLERFAGILEETNSNPMLRLGLDPESFSYSFANRSQPVEQGDAPSYDRLCRHLQ